MTHTIETSDAAGAANSAGADAAASSAAAPLRSEVAQHVDFSAIRYAQSWEDPRCLERALDIQADDRVLSIAAAGDNSFALLLMGDHGPERVVSVDMNPSQVALVKLKRAAILTLTHEEMLRLLGVTAGHDRGNLYAKARTELDAEARAFWDANMQLIARGVIHIGRLEDYFATFRRYVLPITHTRRQVRDVFTPRTVVDRAIFYDESFANARWNTMIRLFFSKAVLGRLGRDPAFFEHVQLPSVAEHYAGRARQAFAILDPAENPFLQYILLGHYIDLATCHPYLDPANFETLRARMDRLELHCDELEGFLGRHEPGSFSKFNLSDIFEWMSDDLYAAMLTALVRTSAPGGRLAYWNNLVLRSRPESLAHLLQPHPALAADIHAGDRAFLYRAFQVETVTALPTAGGAA